MSEKVRPRDVVRKAANMESLRYVEASRRSRRERKRLLDQLVEYTKKSEKLSAVNETMKTEVKFLEHRVKDAATEVRIQRENGEHFSARRGEVLAYRKKLAEQLSQVRTQISQTKRRLSE
jgi:chromosome segregation ATPase